MRGEDETATQSSNRRSAVTSIYRSIYQCRRATQLRPQIGTTKLGPLRQWTTCPARDNITVAFSRTTIVTSVNTVAAAGAAARSRSPSDQDAAGAIATAPSGCPRPRTCLGVNYQIPAQHALLSRGRTVLRPVRRLCTRQIPFPTCVPALAPRYT
jgi:hypothetical protein